MDKKGYAEREILNLIKYAAGAALLYIVLKSFFQAIGK